MITTSCKANADALAQQGFPVVSFLYKLDFAPDLLRELTTGETTCIPGAPRVHVGQFERARYYLCCAYLFSLEVMQQTRNPSALTGRYV